MENNVKKGKAIASLVLGIISLVAAWLGWGAIVSLVLAIVGMILGSQAKKEMPADQAGMAKAGFILSLIGLILSAVVLVSCVACVGCIGTAGVLGSMQ
ncbi:MAG: hypothetical protein E7414_03400 [Ruminococcaceae bacterium]|nr:hypothetical protein [Oscillospiraceae bacterium]